ncbi:MAG: ACT domain-containing protein [Bryobacterales bacterium]|nr:ACT domain-containing protein [Bryobacterales bacterium]
MRIQIQPEPLAICRLAPDAAPPEWARGAFCSITRNEDELSIVCDESEIPAEIHAERGFRALKVVGPLDFSLVGVLASIATPLAQAGISIFAISTFDTDYILIREQQLPSAVAALREAGHEVS